MTKKSTEEILEKIGSLGLFQFRVFAIISYAVFFASSVLMVMTFSTAEPPWRCVANATSCNLNGTYKPGHEDYSHRCGIPRKDWEFVVDGDFDSIVTEWDLVCDTAVYASMANSLLFILWIVGSMIASILSDKFGRKTVVIPFTVLACACGFCSAFAEKYWVFALFRALAGVGMGGYSICAFVLIVEYVGVRHRSLIGIGIWAGWILSLWMLALLGYLVQSWRTLTIITSAPGILFFIFWWFTPESLRWLLVKGRIEEAKKTLKAAARVNKKVLTDNDLASLGDEDKESEVRLGDFRDLFASRALAQRTLVSWYAWLVSGLVYYGISLSTPSVGGNMYLNFFISAICEAVGMAIAVPLLNRFGRRKAIVGSLWLCGIVTIAAALLNYYDDGSTGYVAGKILTALVLGKLFITVVFDGVYVYSSELFPTVVRNTAMGTSTSAARVGSALSPYVVFSERAHPLIPFGIMAVNAFICGILCLTLPETNNVVMPDTIKQVTMDSDSVTGYEENEKLNKIAIDAEDECPATPSQAHISKMYALVEYC